LLNYLKNLIHNIDNTDKKKYGTIILIFVLFLCFSLFHLIKSSRYDVLEVITPFEFVLDKNHNGVADENETIRVLKDYQYISRENINQKEADNYGVSLEVISALAYLTEKFSNDVLADKKVDYKVIKGHDSVFIQKEDYKDILLKSGYIFKDGKPVNIEAFNKRLNQIKKADYKIYNAKSNKYHQLTCEYGLKAHNYVLLAKYQLPKGAKPCKACLGEGSVKNKKHSHKTHKLNKTFSANFSKVPVPALIYTGKDVKIYLTDFTTKLKPDRNGNTAICNEIVNQINLAKSTIDIAIYGYDRVPKIEAAIKKAIARGVQIRLVHDIDSNGKNIYEHTFLFSDLIKNSTCDRAPSFVKNKGYYTNSIMHDKFYIFDNSTVITGSANLSFTDMSGFNSNAVIMIKSPQIAQIFTKEFEQMYSQKFHSLKTKICNKENITLGNSVYSVYFSPADGIISNVLVPIINSAKKYIYIPAFLITDNRLAQTLIAARQRGVDIKIVVDATNAKNNYSKHKLLRQNGIQVKTENYAGKLHSKSMIIDDKYTIIGSMNFSSSGDKKNDENIIVIKDSNITKFYKTFFIYLWTKIDNFWLTHDVSAESVYSIGSCSDGIDNDYDGLTDMQDDGCKFKTKANQKP